MTGSSRNWRNDYFRGREIEWTPFLEQTLCAEMWAVYELKLKIRSANVSDSHTHILEKSSHQPNNLTLSPKAQTVLDVCRWFSFLLDSLTGCVFFLLMALLCCSQSCHFHTNGCANSLTEAETYPNMQLNFEHKLQDWSAETGLMTFAR